MRKYGDKLPPCFGTYRDSWCDTHTCCEVIKECNVVNIITKLAEYRTDEAYNE